MRKANILRNKCLALLKILKFQRTNFLLKMSLLKHQACLMSKVVSLHRNSTIRVIYDNTILSQTKYRRQNNNTSKIWVSSQIPILITNNVKKNKGWKRKYRNPSRIPKYKIIIVFWWKQEERITVTLRLITEINIEYL